MKKEEAIDKLKDLEEGLFQVRRSIEREEWMGEPWWHQAQQAKERIIERVDKVLIREGVGLELRLRIMHDITKGDE